MSGFEIKIVEQGGILYFTLKGPGTYAHLLRAVTAIITETKSREIWHVLCDARTMTNPMGAFEKFEAGAELARGADPRMKMAVLAQLEAIDYIFENVTRNRGLDVAVFKSESTALQWLHRDK